MGIKDIVEVKIGYDGIVLANSRKTDAYKLTLKDVFLALGMARSKAHLDEIVHTSLEKAGLIKEVHDRLSEPGTGLSGGQQQRLCIARAIAVEPHVILMDEPCSALDPIATAKIEELMDELKRKYTIAIVTHSMQQAARVSQKTAFFHPGDLVEAGETAQMFTNPKDERTESYISGRIG